MSEVTVGWLNAAMAFHDPDHPERQAEMLNFVGHLEHRPQVLMVGEFTVGAAGFVDLVNVGEALAQRGYRLAAVKTTDDKPGERGASTTAVLVRNDVERSSLQVQPDDFDMRKGYVVTFANGIQIAGWHGHDADTAKRRRSAEMVVGELALRNIISRPEEPESDLPVLNHSIAMADFNDMSPQDNRLVTHTLRWLHRHTTIDRLHFDFYGDNTFKRLAGFGIRAMRMADGGSRAVLEASGMHGANSAHNPTCFNGPEAIALSLDDIYISRDGAITSFTQIPTTTPDQRRISDHDLLLATAQFAD